MSIFKITNAGELYKNRVTNGELTPAFSRIVFGKKGVDGKTPITDETMPTITHSALLTAQSRINDNAIVFSVVLGYEVGDFAFDWYGLIAEDEHGNSVLIAIVHTDLTQKTARNEALLIEGNYKALSIIWRTSNIAELMQIQLPAAAWQVGQNEFLSRAEFSERVKTDVPANAEFTDTKIPLENSYTANNDSAAASSAMFTKFYKYAQANYATQTQVNSAKARAEYAVTQAAANQPKHQKMTADVTALEGRIVNVTRVSGSTLHIDDVYQKGDKITVNNADSSLLNVTFELAVKLPDDTSTSVISVTKKCCFTLTFDGAEFEFMPVWGE